MDRRRFLGLVGGSSLLGVAGCAGGTGVGQDQREEGSDTTRPARDAESVRQWAKDAEPQGPERANGARVSAERTVTDDPGYEQDGLEYFPGNDTVRYVSLSSGGEPVEFDTWSLEEWGTIESARVATVRAGAVAERRLGTEGVVTGVTTAPDSDERSVAVLRVQKTVSRDGDVVSWPAATFPALRDVAPRSVDVTMSIEGDSFARTVPVYAEYRVLRRT